MFAVYFFVFCAVQFKFKTCPDQDETRLHGVRVPRVRNGDRVQRVHDGDRGRGNGERGYFTLVIRWSTPCSSPKVEPTCQKNL